MTAWFQMYHESARSRFRVLVVKCGIEGEVVGEKVQLRKSWSWQENE